MESERFDRTLRDVVAGEDLPYNPAAWDQLSQRLAAHNAGTLLAATPAAPKPVRKPLVRRWLPAAAACAACLLLGWGLAQLRRADAPVPSRPTAAAPPAQPPASGPAGLASAGMPASPAARLAVAVPDRAQEKKRILSTATPPPASIAAFTAVDTATVPAAGTAASTASTLPPSQPSPARLQESLPAGNPFHNLETAPVRRQLALDLNGGYNLANTRGGFAVGVNLKRSVSRRLQVEAGVAVVGSAYTTYQATTSPVPDAGTTGAGGVLTPTTTTQYEEAVGRVLYLQAAPTLSYRITERFSAGTGVDVQRLLGAPAVARTATGDEGAVQPLWDFGLTGRLDYRLLPRLKTGLQYRGSLGGTADVPGDVVRRNYLQLQVSYSVF